MGLEDKVVKEYQKKVEVRMDEMGLRMDKIKFFSADTEDIAVIASYGHKERHGHWSFGADYLKIKEAERAGQFHIHEIVINTSPVRAYLNQANSEVEDKLVINHVYGHVDFHMSNVFYSKVDMKNLLEDSRENSSAIDKYSVEYGELEVEEILDACLTVAPYVNEYEKLLKVDPNNLVTFILDNAPLDEWEKDLLTRVKEETLAFQPIGKVKIMEEGWASYIQEKLAFNKELVPDHEALEFVDMHSKVTLLSMGPQFPYAMGYLIWSDIEEKYGFDECLKIRENYSDVDFIISYMSQDIVDKNIKQYQQVQMPDGSTGYQRVPVPVEQIRDSLVGQLLNSAPKLVIEKSGKDLDIFHVYEEEKQLDPDIIEGFMENVSRLWKNPVHLETYDDKANNIIYTYDPKKSYGEKFNKKLTDSKRSLDNLKINL